MNLFELTLQLNGFNINKAKKELFDLHSLQPEDYEKKQQIKLEEIVRFHKANNPLYQEKTCGLTTDTFYDLPLITKKDLQRPIESVISRGYRKSDLYISNTSGSSGHPFFFARDKYSHALAHAITLSCYAEHNITPLSKQARFYGIPLSGVSRYKELVKDFLSNRVRFPVFDLSDQQLAIFTNKFTTNAFEYIYGYTSAIVQFAKYLIRNNIILKEIVPSLECCIVTSEVCTSEDREILKKAFDIPIVNEYGSSETGLIAFENRAGDWRILTDNLFVEIVDESNNPLPYGSEGRILITSLSNKAFPIIRYEIGDIGIMEEINGILVLRKLLGRISDVVRLPSGRIAAGLTFYYISRSLLENLGFVKEFIIRQTKIDTFVFDAVMERDFSNEEIDFFNLEMAKYLEPNLNVIINRLDRIERPSSGKIKHFYSEL